MVFKSIRGSPSATDATCVVGVGSWLAEQVHPAYIPRPSSCPARPERQVLRFKGLVHGSGQVGNEARPRSPRFTRSLRAVRKCETAGPRTETEGFAHFGEQGPDLRIRGALGGTRTPNLLIRSQMLYPLSYERRSSVVLPAVSRVAATTADKHSQNRTSDSSPVTGRAYLSRVGHGGRGRTARARSA
jgi:hypothetical protein